MRTIDELGISPTPWDKRVRFDVNELVSTDKDGHTQVVFAWTKDVINKRTPNNARLIAAAPELYEAVTYLLANLNLFAPQSLRNKMKKTIQFAEKALANASGEEVK